MPVEHRVLGLDRRTLLPGLVVIGIFVVLTLVIPAIDDRVSYTQETKAGDVFALANGITMDAQPGWGVDSGLLTTDQTRSQSPGAPVTLTKDGAALTVYSGPFRGTPKELLGQIAKVDSAVSGDKAYHVSGDVVSFHTNAGHPGVAQRYSTVSGNGIVSALVYGDKGLKITYTGPTSATRGPIEEAGRMIDSISDDEGAAR